MARRYKRLNKYDSRLRRCAISGLRFYESEMVQRLGYWIHPKYLDEDGVPATKRIGAPTLQALNPVQDYWEYDSSDRLMPRLIIPVRSSPYSYWELDSSSRVQSKSVHDFPDDDRYWEISPTVLVNIIVNGDMEEDSNWDDYGTPTANAQSNTQVYRGNWSRMFSVDALYQGIKSDSYTSETGVQYTYSFWYYSDQTGVGVRVRRGDNVTWAENRTFGGYPANQWHYIEYSFTEVGGGNSAYIAIQTGNAISTGTWYVDNVKVEKEVPTSGRIMGKSV